MARIQVETPAGAQAKIDAHAALPNPHPTSSPFVYTQSIPQSLTPPIEHGLGYRPPSVALFSLDWSIQFDEYQVIHLDSTSLRIACDQPSAFVALIK